VSGIRFTPGSVVATPGVLEAFRTSGDDPLAYLVRHIAGDWGDVDEHDRVENELSLQHGWPTSRQSSDTEQHSGRVPTSGLPTIRPELQNSRSKSRNGIHLLHLVLEERRPYLAVAEQTESIATASGLGK
jgi:hypothetical protein